MSQLYFSSTAINIKYLFTNTKHLFYKKADIWIEDDIRLYVAVANNAGYVTTNYDAVANNAGYVTTKKDAVANNAGYVTTK